MEFVAWFVHKYIMHGVLWIWHESHHLPHNHKSKNHFFEKNDLFFLVFAIPSAIGFILSSYFQTLLFLRYVAIGIAFYGFVYFLIHDVYIHQRFKWFQILNNKYSRAICKAHFSHHKSKIKANSTSFGLLIVAKKFFGK